MFQGSLDELAQVSNKFLYENIFHPSCKVLINDSHDFGSIQEPGSSFARFGYIGDDPAYYNLTDELPIGGWKIHIAVEDRVQGNLELIIRVKKC